MTSIAKTIAAAKAAGKHSAVFSVDEVEELQRLRDAFERDYTAVGGRNEELHDMYMAAIREHERLQVQVAGLTALVREVLDEEPAEMDDSGFDRCLFCGALLDDDLDDGNPHEPDCWIVRADAALATAAPDASLGNCPSCLDNTGEE